MKQNRVGKIAIIAFSTALFGQVYVNPFNTDFRISIGVVVMTLLVLKFKDAPIMSTMVVTGLTVVLFRILLGYFSGQTMMDLYSTHYPAFFFYLTYGILMRVFDVRGLVDQPILLVTFLGLSDVFSNVIEAATRYEFVNVTAKIVLPSLFFVGFLRALIIFVLHLGLVFYSIVILKDENNQKIKEFLMLASKMRAESFFLRKGMSDIENAMNKSYYLYNQMMGIESEDVTDAHLVEFRREILELTKDIHEVKKDNERVIAGIEKLIPDIEQLEELKFDEMIKMLMENTSNLARMQGKEILLREFIVFKNLTIKNYFPMITILINLLSNAVDAIESEGYIMIEQPLDSKYLVLDIIDNGIGVKREQREIIFEPGYSTKFDSETGKMSSGIGLTHVRELVRGCYEGDIEVIGKETGRTCFRVRFLKEKLMEAVE